MSDTLVLFDIFLIHKDHFISKNGSRSKPGRFDLIQRCFNICKCSIALYKSIVAL